MEQKLKKQTPVTFLLKGLLCSYVVTGVLLFILAFLLYQFRLSEQVISIGIIVIYIMATFFAGFLAGKKIGSKKYMWGFLMGAVYFALLLLVSLCVNRGVDSISTNLVTTFFLCAGSGMLGGMIS